MFRDVRFTVVLRTMFVWGSIASCTWLPLMALRLIPGFDASAADLVGLPQHPVTVGKFFVGLIGLAVGFLAAVLGFWVAIAREKTRARDREGIPGAH